MHRCEICEMRHVPASVQSMRDELAAYYRMVMDLEAQRRRALMLVDSMCDVIESRSDKRTAVDILNVAHSRVVSRRLHPSNGDG